jgi:hypothetical protein
MNASLYGFSIPQVHKQAVRPDTSADCKSDLRRLAQLRQVVDNMASQHSERVGVMQRQVVLAEQRYRAAEEAAREAGADRTRAEGKLTEALSKVTHSNRLHTHIQI